MRHVVPALIALAACGESVDSMRSPECVAQDEKVRTLVDDQWMAPNPLVVVKNATCGNTVYVGGSEANATSESLWRIGSVTKTFVSAAILSLAKEGTLSLDDSLDRFVPNVPNTTGVTVRMLLAHRSGVYNYTEDPAFFMNRTEPWTPRQIVDLATSHPPDFAPGAGFHYSNTNYILLGMIIEAATSKPVATVLHERAIDPAGLVHTFLDGAEPVPEPIATGYSYDYIDVTNYWEPSGLWTAGAIVASASDITDWVSTVYGTDIVLDASQRAALTADATQVASSSFGLGVQSRYVLNVGVGLGHNGALDGYYTYAMYFADKDTAVAAAVNRDGGQAEPLFLATLRALFP